MQFTARERRGGGGGELWREDVIFIYGANVFLVRLAVSFLAAIGAIASVGRHPDQRPKWQKYFTEGLIKIWFGPRLMD